MHKLTPSMTMTRTPGLTFEERRVLRLLANHTYDEVVQETGWSCGRIYNLAYESGPARKLGIKWSLLVFLLVEIVLVIWIKDGLLLQILMLIFPVDAIKMWQMCR